MDIVDAAKFLCEPSEIVSFSESGKLRCVVEPHVHDAFYTRFTEKFKELLCGLLREACLWSKSSSVFLAGYVRNMVVAPVVWPTRSV